jgi:hypothetical protein
MRAYKKFVFLMVSFLILLFAFHVIAWNMYTKYVFPDTYSVGDLGRLSYSVENLSPRINETTLDKKHIEYHQWDGQAIDILTLGDSISNGGAGGKNPYYQDYIATDYNKTVMNIQVLEKQANYIEMIYLLENSGLLKKINPRAIIIESTERSTLERFSLTEIDENKTLEINQLHEYMHNSKWEDGEAQLKKVSFINNLNINAIKYNLLYPFDDNAFFSSCYQTQLNQKMFTSLNGKTLLFYKDTIPYYKSISKDKIMLLNQNLNELAIFLHQRGIQLYFMPAVDKLNLYSKYIVNNKYGESTFFEQLRPLEKEYILIDTKAVLEKEVDRGVKDIFYSDDTHWSYKASEAIAKNLKNNDL